MRYQDEKWKPQKQALMGLSRRNPLRLISLQNEALHSHCSSGERSHRAGRSFQFSPSATFSVQPKLLLQALPAKSPSVLCIAEQPQALGMKSGCPRASICSTYTSYMREEQVRGILSQLYHLVGMGTNLLKIRAAPTLQFHELSMKYIFTLFSVGLRRK